MFARWKPQEISYRDLKFERILIQCRDASGNVRLRWIDVGMPRIPWQVDINVFYLFRDDPRSGQRTGPHGTGFFVCRHYRNPPTTKAHHYAVSNWHVVNKIGASIIRVNTRDGRSRPIESDPSEWHFVPDADDLCVLDVTDRFDPNDDVTAIQESEFADRETISTYEMRMGEDAFMVGLFVEHDGGLRNSPSARFGNVSRMASDGHPIKQPNGNARPSHVIDLRSRSGFSGSPVYVYRTYSSDLSTEFTDDLKKSMTGALLLFTEKEHFLKLLGVHCSQFLDILKIKAGALGESSVDHDGSIEGSIEDNPNVVLKDGDKLYIPSSMTVVVPAWRITEVLNLPGLAEMRKKREINDDDTSIPEPESAATSAADDANPHHLEDFKRLVDVAARKRPQGDQT